VVRVAKDEVVTEVSGPRQEGDTLVLPVYEEVLVVEKRLRLVEEVHITTRRSERNEVQEVLLRQETVRLERDGEEVTV
jgi:stress response protein YsnF